jgi:hypothetical protein
MSPARVALQAHSCVQRHPGHPGVQAAACALYAGLAACAGCPCADGAALAEKLGGPAGVAALLHFDPAGAGASTGMSEQGEEGAVDAGTQRRHDLLDQEYERALSGHPGSGGSSPIPPGIADHRPLTPDSAAQHDGAAWGDARGVAPRGRSRSSEDSRGDSDGPSVAEVLPQGWATPALGAFVQRGPPAPTAPPLAAAAASSLFGTLGSGSAGSLSPRADMPLFGSPSPGAPFQIAGPLPPAVDLHRAAPAARLLTTAHCSARLCARRRHAGSSIALQQR